MLEFCQYAVHMSASYLCQYADQECDQADKVTLTYGFYGSHVGAIYIFLMMACDMFKKMLTLKGSGLIIKLLQLRTAGRDMYPWRDRDIYLYFVRMVLAAICDHPSLPIGIRCHSTIPKCQPPKLASASILLIGVT